MLLYNKLNTECWIIWASTENDRGRRTEETTLSDCGLDLTSPSPATKARPLPGSVAGQGGEVEEAAEKSGEHWPGKALLKDSFSLTAAFSSNWISDEAQSPFANAYENVFFQLPPPLSPTLSLVRFPCWKLMRLTGFWRNLMPRSFGAFINIEIIYQRTDKRNTAHRTPELTPNWNPNDDWLQSGEFNGTLSTVSEKNTA